MPRTPEENERIRQAARAQILTHAMGLFLAKGYHATSIDDVAREAKVSKGLLYHYFAGKENLLAAMVAVRLDELRAVMETAAGHATPAAQIRHVIAGALENVRQQPNVFRFYLNLSTQPPRDTIVAKYAERLNAEARAQFEVQTAMFVRLGVANPRQRSLYFSATLQGVMLMLSTYQEDFPLDAIKAQMIAEFCGSVEH